METKIPTGLPHEGEYHLETWTRPASMVEEHIRKRIEALLEEYEYADIGIIQPVYFAGQLHYTYTITAGDLA